MFQEISWAAGETVYPDAAFLLKRSGGYYDPQIRRKIPDGSREDLKARRIHIREYFEKAFEADIFILTLGLAEYWQDEETILALTEAPDPHSLRTDPHRYTFRVATSDEVISDLVGIRDLIHKHGKSGCKMVVTTSPVPMRRTFTSQDVIVANMQSKSILRVAALRFAQTFDDVDYYPSYEGTMLSDRRIVWACDHLHVSDFFVGKLIKEFLRRYGLEVESESEAVKHDDNSLLTELRRAVDKYKSEIIKLNRELDQARSRV